jgi:guanylate kinase
MEEIFKMDTSLKRIITCTTRPARGLEQHGEDYFFMSQEEFAAHQKNGDFIESSEVYGNNYGVLLSSIKDKISGGESALFSINWEGFSKIKKILCRSVYGFFLLPPSMDELEARMKKRGTDSKEVMVSRMNAARDDMSHSGEFDTCLVNKDAVETAKIILNQMNTIRQNV